MKKYILFAISVILLNACVSEPTAPLDDKIITGKTGAYIICEGLWHYDNSSLSQYIADSNSVVNNIYNIVNTGERLGDLANGGAIFGDYLYIVMTTSSTIEKIDLKTGKSVAKLQIAKDSDPRKIYIVNESLAYLSCLRTHSVRAINPSSMQDLNINIPTGPAPEFICGTGQYVFVANSGYGDYLANVPKAGTISVIDISSNQVIKELYCGPNAIEVKVNAKRNTLYGVYYHLPSETDSVGGIVEYDLSTLKETRRIRIRSNALNFSHSGDSLVFATDSGVMYADLNQAELTPKLMIANPNTDEKWYSVAVSPDNRLFIGNAKNYQMQGELLIYNFTVGGSLLNKFQIGINPNTILFY